MKSYIYISRGNGVTEIKAKLHDTEITELATIRHYIVRHITEIIAPSCTKVTFRWEDKK